MAAAQSKPLPQLPPDFFDKAGRSGGGSPQELPADFFDKQAGESKKDTTAPALTVEQIKKLKGKERDVAIGNLIKNMDPNTKVMGSPVLPGSQIIPAAIGFGVEKLGEKAGLPWWVNVPAGILAGGIASGSGAIYQRLKALPAEQRADAFRKAATKLPWGIGKLAEAYQEIFGEKPPTGTISQKAPRLRWSTEVQEAKPTGTISRKAPPIRNSTQVEPAPAEPKATGTISQKAPRLRWSTTRAAEAEEGAGAPKTPTAPKTPGGETGGETQTPPHARSLVLESRGAAKRNYMAARFEDSGLTPEQVERMPDDELEEHILSEGKALQSRGAIKSSFKKYDPNNPGNTPYNIMKLEIAKAMRVRAAARAAGKVQ